MTTPAQTPVPPAAPTAAPTAGGAPDLAARRAATLQVLAAIAKHAQAAKRADLFQRLQTAAGRIGDGSIRIVVAGEFKKGKSSLVNALLGSDVCPVDDDIATAVPTLLKFSEQPTAVAVRVDGDPPAEHADPLPDAEHIRAAVTAGTSSLRRVEIGTPAELLRGGVVLIDTPGVGGIRSQHQLRTLGLLPAAHAVLFVSDATQEYTQPEVQFLATARKLCQTVVCVMAKTDIFPFSDQIVETNRRHLAAAGIDVPLFPVSCALRQRARRAGDDALDAASGLPALEQTLRDVVVAQAEAVAVRAALADGLAVLEQLAGPLAAAQKALSSPDQRKELEAGLAEAKARADALRAQTAKWQIVLNDGIIDLNTDIDYDLRSRMRVIGQEADAALDQSDPAAMWDEFSQWLTERVGYDVTENYVLLTGRAKTLIANVATMFAEDAAEATRDRDVAAPTHLLATIMDPELPKAALSGGAPQTALSLLRNTYSSVSMFGSMGTMVHVFRQGLTFNPVSLGLGLLLSSRTVSDERTKQLDSRRAQAKSALRKYTDEVSFVVGKDSRDAIKTLQRQLRDTYSARAEELSKSAAAAVAQAQQAAVAAQKGQQEKLAQVTAALTALQQLAKQAAGLAPAVPAAPVQAPTPAPVSASTPTPVSGGMA